MLGFIIMALISFSIFHHLHHNQNTTASNNSSRATTSSAAGLSTNQYATLSPATVPSKAAECSQQVTFSSNGNSGPVQCSNGDLNVTVWNALATLEPSVLSLGYSASVSQIETALCNDVKSSQSDANTNNSSVIEATVYQISALYYGWNFPTDPTIVLSNGSC
jgi:hypothetical protein